MKKLFTLMASALFALTASAQQADFVDRVVNGDMEGEQDPEWSCFWVHEWRDMSEQFSGFANIVEDPENPTNHCAKVVVRSATEAIEAGNMTMIDTGNGLVESNMAGWDSQFFVYVQEAILPGDKVKLTMRVKADKECSVGTQAHCEPGNYNHWACAGNIAFTTEWKTITSTFTVSNDMVGGVTDDVPNKEFHTVTLNLADFKEGNVCYFDDIKLEVQPATPPSEFEGWFDLVRNGDLKNDIVNNFVCRDADNPGEGYTDDSNSPGDPARINPDRPAQIITDKDGKPAIFVRTSAATYWKTENEDGTHSDPRIVYPDGTDCVLWDWQAQFFVTSPHEFTSAGEKMMFTMEARADQATTIQSQIHAGPGDYIHWQMFGDISLSEDWEYFEFEVDLTGDQVARPARTVAFNLNTNKESDNTIYFRNIHMYCNKADVTDITRTLGTGTFYLPVAKDNEGTTEAEIDLTEAIKTLAVADFGKFIKSQSLKVNADEKGTLSAAFSPIDGVFLNDKGVEDENGSVIVEMSEDSKDNIAKFTITNIGGEFAAGKEINTRFCFVSGDWYYIYNVILVDQDKYNSLAGINDVTAKIANKGIIFDLQGRKLAAKPVKGLYIMDGKKFFQK